MIRAVMASSCGAAAAIWPPGKSACRHPRGLVIASVSACSACERGPGCRSLSSRGSPCRLARHRGRVPPGHGSPIPRARCVSLDAAQSSITREHTIHVPVQALIGSAIAGCALTRRLLASMQSSLCSASWTLACCSAQSCRPAHAQKGQSRHGRWLGSRWHASAGMLRPTLNPYTVSTSVVSAWACGVRIVLVLVLGFPPRPLASD